MKRVFSVQNLLFVIVFAFIAYQFYIANLDGSEMVKQGDVQLVHREYSQALDSFDKALEDIKRSGTAFFFETGWTIEKARNRLKAWHGIGSAYAGMGDHEAAEQYLSKVLDENGFFTESRIKRASVRYAMGNYDGAVADLSRLLETAPNAVHTLYNRGSAFLGLKAYIRAVADYTRVVALIDNGVERPESIYMRNTLARLLATCPLATVRDGGRAVMLAQSVVASAEPLFTSREGKRALAGFNDTLAAAYAEQGRFDDAVNTIEQALLLVTSNNGTSGDIAMLQSHLALFEEGKILTETPAPLYFH